MSRIVPSHSNVDFWRENSNINVLKKVAKMSRNAPSYSNVDLIFWRENSKVNIARFAHKVLMLQNKTFVNDFVAKVESKESFSIMTKFLQL